MDEIATNGLETRHGKIPLLSRAVSLLASPSSEARDDAIYSMQQNKKKTEKPSQVHSLYTANGSLSLSLLHVYLRLPVFLFFFVLIAFSVVGVAGPRKYQRGRKRLLRGGSTRQRRSPSFLAQQQQQQSGPFFKMC